MIKFILKTLMVLVFILIAAVIGVYFYAGEIVKKAVETYVPQITQTSAKLEGMDLSLAKGEVSLNGLSIGNPKGYKSPDVFSVNSVKVLFRPTTLLHDKIIIDQILIDGTHVSAEATYKDGQILSNLTTIKGNVDSFLKNSSKEKEPTKKEEPTVQTKSKKTVVVKDLQVNNSSLTLGFLEQTVEVPLPDIKQQNIGEKGKKQTIQDIIVYVFDLISVESIKAVAKGTEDLIKQSAQKTIEGVNKLVDDAKKSSEGLIDSVKGLF
ncbi:MAG: AsmA family protein [Alphaproteobacteria bacterium]|nr:AsmA family protein [Alphaproteobacteria bacterium]